MAEFGRKHRFDAFAQKTAWPASLSLRQFLLVERVHLLIFWQVVQTSLRRYVGGLHLWSALVQTHAVEAGCQAVGAEMKASGRARSNEALDAAGCSIRVQRDRLARVWAGREKVRCRHCERSGAVIANDQHNPLFQASVMSAFPKML